MQSGRASEVKDGLSFEIDKTFDRWLRKGLVASVGPAGERRPELARGLWGLVVELYREGFHVPLPDRDELVRGVPDSGPSGTRSRKPTEERG